jgi:catechol 2,3-dioxygenase
MSSCLIRGVRSVELVVSNLSEAARFYTDIWRLAPVEMPPPNPPPHAGEGRERAQYFRGTGGYHHLLGVHLGARPAVIRIVFDLADRQAIAHLHRVMERAGLKPTAPAELGAPGGGYGFGCKDPDGRNLVFVCECAEHADTADRADRPRKIAHVNLNARDFDASLAFFTQTLGFRLVDENAPLWFLHCANADHCSIVLAKTGLPTLNHIAFEMPDSDSVMRGIGRMKDSAIPSNGVPDGTGRGIMSLPISAGRTRCHWNIPPRSCRSTILTSRAGRLTGNMRRAGPISGASHSRVRRAIIACSACSASPRTAIGLPSY